MSKANNLVLGFLVPNEISEELLKSNASAFQLQTQIFASNFVRTLNCGAGAVHALSAMPIADFPKSKIIFSSFIYSNDDFELLVIYPIPFVNLIILKHITRFITSFLKFNSLRLAQRYQNVFIHGVHTPFLLVGVFSKYFFRDNVIVIITDPPSVITKADGFFRRVLKRVDRLLISSLVKMIGKSVCLSDELIKTYGLSKDSSIVVSGFIDDEYVKVGYKRIGNIKSNELLEIRRIIYAGSLSESYGIKTLINSIICHKEICFEMVFYGTGDLVSEIKKLSVCDNRIKYGGVLAPSKMREEFSKSDFLINPRPARSFQSVNSFPSKIFEYILSGTPLISTNLESFPSELKKYLVLSKGDDAESLANAIVYALSMTKDELCQNSLGALKFVESHFSARANFDKLNPLLRNIS